MLVLCRARIGTSLTSPVEQLRGAVAEGKCEGKEVYRR